MKLLVNGQGQEVPEGLSVAGLLGHLGVAPDGVAVEVDRQVVPKAQYDSRRLGPGSQVEIVEFVGGG